MFEKKLTDKNKHKICLDSYLPTKTYVIQQCGLPFICNKNTNIERKKQRE